MEIKVGVSNHHVHLTRKDLDTLFGNGYELNNKRDLVQKGQFACEETVTIKRNEKILEHIRIIGPCRNYTQVELLDTDNEYFGINAPVRSSGDLKGSEGMEIIGPKGSVKLSECAIVSNTHIHMSADDLISFNVNNKDIVSVEFENGSRLDDVHIKSDETCVLELHINKDLANSLGVETGMSVKIC